MHTTKTDSQSVTLNIRLPKHERDRLAHLAKIQGMTQSGVIREFIRHLPTPTPTTTPKR